MVEQIPVTDSKEEEKVEGDEAEENELVLRGESRGSSVSGEEYGVLKGGNAESEGEEVKGTKYPQPKETGEEVTVESIVMNTLRVNLSEFTLIDPTLITARALADKSSEGYQWEEELVFRCIPDQWGSNYKQLCLPQQYRERCMTMANEKFGHQGRNKMVLHIRKLFYWPSMTTDIARHCKSCDVCQRHTKAHQKVHTMQEREVVSVPSERVFIDLVGPFR